MNLTDQQKEALANAGIDWTKIFAALQTYGPQVIQLVLGILALLQPAPTPTPPKAAAPGCCDHHACCTETLKAALKTVECAAKHVCECCSCEGGYG